VFREVRRLHRGSVQFIEIQIFQRRMDQFLQTAVFLLQDQFAVCVVVEGVVDEIGFHLKFVFFFVSCRGVSQAYMMQIGFGWEVRVRSPIFLVPKVQNEALCLLYQRILRLIDGIQRLLVLGGSMKIRVPLPLHPFPHGADRLLAEDGKAAAAGKGIVPQFDRSGAVVHALHVENTPVVL